MLYGRGRDRRSNGRFAGSGPGRFDEKGCGVMHSHGGFVGKKNKPIQACVAGGKPPCPICPVKDKCAHGIKMVGKNERVLTREVKEVGFDRWSNGRKRKGTDVPAAMTPSEAGKALSDLAKVKRKFCCPMCQGSGATGNIVHGMEEPCPACDGTGFVRENR